MYHIFSFLLGVLALGMVLLGGRKPDFRFYSMSACGLSILCQLAEMGRMAKNEDASALFDIAPASSLVAAALFFLTLGLNFLELYRGYCHEK